MIPELLRILLPVPVRVRLRQSPAARWLLKRVVGGKRSKPFPGTNWRFHYDGYVNVGFAARDLDVPEREERERVFALLRREPPRIVWDVGSNIGFWSMHLSRAFPDIGELRCFEPDPSNLAMLRQNCQENGFTNWTIRAVGLSDRAGTATFYADPETGATGSIEADQNFIGRHYKMKQSPITVTLTTIDEEIADGAVPPDFIKLDVEGHELAVFRGAAQTLRQHRPKLFFEATRHEDELAVLLAEAGYEMYDVNGARLTRPVYATIAVAAGSAMANALAKKQQQV